MIKTGKHYKLVSKIGKILGIGVLIGGGMLFYSFPNVLISGRQKDDVIRSTGYETYVTEQTEIYDSQLQNNEISKDEYDELCKELEDVDGYIKENGTPLQNEYYNLSKNNEKNSFILLGVSIGTLFAFGMSGGLLIDIAEEMEKKYKKYIKNYGDINNYQI